MLLTGGADRPTAEARGGMRLEAGFVRLPMHELLGAADAADQKEAEQLLVAVIRPGPSGRTCSRRVPERMA